MTVSAIPIMKKIVKRIPGKAPPTPKSEIDGKITNLSAKTIPELLELKERQMKLLKNKLFISKLNDKGAKIQELYNKIGDQLKVKQEEQEACQLLEKLNINVGNKSVQDIEWKSKINSKNEILDSDDDSEPEDVLQILSQRTATEKTVKISKPENPLITVDDLIEIGEIPHVKYLVDITETNNCTPKPTGHFKPYKTTISDVHNPEKEILRKKNKHWEVTAATPPPIIHGPAKVLGLEESLKLQLDYNSHLKEVEAKHAAERLVSRSHIKMATLPDDVTKFGKYRDIESESDASDIEGSDKEVHDEDPEGGGVIYTVMN